MSTYKVRLYQNTGFNGVNIPENKSLLNKCSYVDVDSVIILQNRGLDHIDVNATWDQVENVDYVRVGDWYYSVPSHGTKMLSVSTARLVLISDPLTSAGGFTVDDDGTVTTKFDILDGITERCTVNSDDWGQYTNEDPLIVPQEPLEIQTSWLNTGSSNSYIFIESTVDLPNQATPNFKYGITYTDPETKETVTIPETAPIRNTTDFVIDGSTVSNGTKIYWKNDTSTSEDGNASVSKSIENGLQVIHSLGQEQGSIINQYRVPGNFIGTVSVEYGDIQGEGSDASNVGRDQNISSISGTSSFVSSGISPDYATVKNKRVLYGAFNKYGLITCSGNSVEFRPEELGSETTPTVSYKSDPRPHGKPYYRFTTINGDTDFWRNCLAGSEWENVPLIYQGASGSALTRLNFENDRKIKSQQIEQQREQTVFNMAKTGTGMVTDIALGAATMGVGSSLGGLAGLNMTRSGQNQIGNSFINGMFDIGQDVLSQDQAERMYRIEKANELSELYQSTDIYAPTVNFPYNADILRDVKGNGVLVYKYRMSDNDVKRIDKLLTMYGYQTNEQLTPSNFGRRKHFDYIACRSVSITGLPKWWCDDIATMLKVGVRVWHELPNTDAYKNNPIRS